MKTVSPIFATWQGLGVMAQDYYRNSLITHPVIVRHGRHENHLEWYPDGTPVIADLKRDTTKVMTDVLKGADLFLALETPFDWSLIPLCRQMGVKTVISPNHECMPAKIPHQPDLWLCPSLLDFEWACRQANHQSPPRKILEVSRDASVVFHGHGPDIWFLPVPVDVDRVKYRERTEAKVFVHNAGHGGLKGRNGTAEVLAALRYVESGADFVVRSQSPIVGNGGLSTTRGGGSIRYITGTQPYDTLYDEGDVFLFPEGFNGLSLPLQEAAAAGMLIMAGARWPMTAWLHDDPLIPVHHYSRERIGPPYSEYERAHYDPRAIAAKVDEWYGRDIAEYSRVARQWAEENSWGVWGPVYRGLLKNLVEAPPLRLS